MKKKIMSKKNNKNRSRSANYIKNKEKYKYLLDNDNSENSISNLVKEEEGKIREILDYYNRNREYDEYVYRQKNIFNSNINKRNIEIL